MPGVALRTTFIVGFPGETEADVDELCAFVGDHAFDHVGVFTYSHEEGTSAYRARRRCAGADEDGAARPRHEPAEAAGPAAASAAGSASGPGCSSTGRPRDHDLVLQGAAADPGARTSTPSVYLTDCDPSSFRAGDFAEVEIVGARDYDLIARPVERRRAIIS